MKAARSGVWQLIGRKPLVFMFTGFCQIAEIKAKLILSIWWVEGGKNWPAGFKANQHWPLFKAGSPEQTYPHACLFAEFENLQWSRMHVNWYQKSSQIASRTHILMTAYKHVYPEASKIRFKEIILNWLFWHTNCSLY